MSVPDKPKTPPVPMVGIVVAAAIGGALGTILQKLFFPDYRGLMVGIITGIVVELLWLAGHKRRSAAKQAAPEGDLQTDPPKEPESEGH